MKAKLSDITVMVEEQAKDEGLWFVAKTAPEAYLQMALRRLHSKIENTFQNIDQLGLFEPNKEVSDGTKS